MFSSQMQTGSLDYFQNQPYIYMAIALNGQLKANEQAKVWKLS